MRKKINQLIQDHGESGANGHGLSDMIGARLPNLFLRNCVEGRERKFDGAAKKVGRPFCLPASLSASEFQGAGRQKQRFSISCARPKRSPMRKPRISFSMKALNPPTSSNALEDLPSCDEANPNELLLLHA
jgi:hypothetical protein